MPENFVDAVTGGLLPARPRARREDDAAGAPGAVVLARSGDREHTRNVEVDPEVEELQLYPVAREITPHVPGFRIQVAIEHELRERKLQIPGEHESVALDELEQGSL